MSRFHVHVHVDDVAKSARFYATLFGTEPTVIEADYAKWMLDDPKVNFAISTHGAKGLGHLGIQVDTDKELRQVAARLKAAGEETLDQEATTCCYAKGNKSWVGDPSGLRWETFYTFGNATVYGAGDKPSNIPEAVASTAETASCCRT